VSIPSAGLSESAARPDVARRPGGFPVGDLIAICCLVIEAGLIVFVLRHLLTRPFYYDEGWRAYEIALGPSFLGQLHSAVGPLSLGWLAIENAARVVLGDTEAGLRTPLFLVLPVLGAATYLLARRWLGVAVSFCVAGLLLVNLWIINYGLQLKSYPYEALFAVVTVALYLLLRRTAWRPAQLLGLYAALGLTCVFSLPNLFVAVPLLALDLIETVRARDRVALRVAGEALAGVIALANYVLFLSPQSGVVGTNYFNAQYPPPGIGGFARFTVDGLKSWVPGIITGVAGGNNAAPKYALPPLAHHLLAIGLVIMLAAGVVAAARDVAGRALVVACGGALLFELVGAARHYWPFGLIRQNILIVPMLYVLGGIGAVWLARTLRGLRPAGRGAATLAWWRTAALAVAAAVLAVTVASGGVATAKTFAESSELQTKPTMFGGVKDAVTATRQAALPGDLVIIRAGRSTPVWYGTQWLYYMESYAGWPSAIAARPRIPARDTLSVVYITPAAADRFLAAHRGSPAVFLMEFNLPGYRFPRWAHQESLATLRQFGYCPVREIAYPMTGHLTILKAGCPPA
jgi:outer membrane murein-binding lipoprotein Lpp